MTTHNKKDIENKIKTILARQLGVDAAKIGRNKAIRDLGIDSFGAVELAFALKDEFKFEIDERNFSEIKTINDIIEIVTTKLGATNESK
jgi:acyl carrier protein